MPKEAGPSKVFLSNCRICMSWGECLGGQKCLITDYSRYHRVEDQGTNISDLLIKAVEEGWEVELQLPPGLSLLKTIGPSDVIAGVELSNLSSREQEKARKTYEKIKTRFSQK